MSGGGVRGFWGFRGFTVFGLGWAGMGGGLGVGLARVTSPKF